MVLIVPLCGDVKSARVKLKSSHQNICKMKRSYKENAHHWVQGGVRHKTVWKWNSYLIRLNSTTQVFASLALAQWWNGFWLLLTQSLHPQYRLCLFTLLLYYFLSLLLRPWSGPTIRRTIYAGLLSQLCSKIRYCLWYPHSSTWSSTRSSVP
jgi:hypothetical protein